MMREAIDEAIVTSSRKLSEVRAIIKVALPKVHFIIDMRRPLRRGAEYLTASQRRDTVAYASGASRNYTGGHGQGSGLIVCRSPCFIL